MFNFITSSAFSVCNCLGFPSNPILFQNEVWYIMDCKKDAKIVYGFKEDIKQENLKEAIKNIEKNVKCDICVLVSDFYE